MTLFNNASSSPLQIIIRSCPKLCLVRRNGGIFFSAKSDIQHQQNKSPARMQCGRKEGADWQMAVLVTPHRKFPERIVWAAAAAVQLTIYNNHDKSCSPVHRINSGKVVYIFGHFCESHTGDDTVDLCVYRTGPCGDDRYAMQRRHSSNTDGMPSERWGKEVLHKCTDAFVTPSACTACMLSWQFWQGHIFAIVGYMCFPTLLQHFEFGLPPFVAL